MFLRIGIFHDLFQSYKNCVWGALSQTRSILNEITPVSQDETVTAQKSLDLTNKLHFLSTLSCFFSEYRKGCLHGEKLSCEEIGSKLLMLMAKKSCVEYSIVKELIISIFARSRQVSQTKPAINLFNLPEIPFNIINNKDWIKVSTVRLFPMFCTTETKCKVENVK